MRKSYSQDFVNRALQKVANRGAQSQASIARQLNIDASTLRSWMKMNKPNNEKPKTEKTPDQWSLDEKLWALQETYALNGEALSAWCRKNGLFPHHLHEWKKQFCAEPISTKDTRAIKDENHRLKKALVRKEKALAEAAALLILQKKFQALWEDGEK
jgi:transposase-like protein